jgi:hypothetical protein
VRIISSLASKRFDPKAVAALTTVFHRGDLESGAPATLQPPTPPLTSVELPADVAATVESGRY